MFKKGFLSFKWINTGDEILRLRRNGKLLRGKNVYIWVLPEKRDKAGSRPGISVKTGRGFKNAVSRNLAKRRIIGCIIGNRNLLDKYHSYLIEGRAGCEKEDYQILVMEIRELLGRVI